LTIRATRRHFQKFKSRALFVAAACAAALFLISSYAAFAASKPFDGTWWQGASKSERLGYVEGDSDCNAIELGGHALDPDSLAPRLEFLSSFYAPDSGHADVLVFDALRLAEKQQTSANREPSEDAQGEAHGVYDGLFWRNMLHAERLGFVEGYLACDEHKTQGRRASYSKSAEEYVALLDQWYHVKDVEEDVDPKFEDRKIGDVLYRFRDRHSLGHK
jgi:hypothetical protein